MSPVPTQNAQIGSKIAFFAYLTHGEQNPSKHFTFIFDHVVTNTGNGYNQHTGAFTSPVSGTFAFLWNMRVYKGDTITELVINSEPVTVLQVQTTSYTPLNTNCGFAIMHVNVNDVVFVRKHPTHLGVGDILSDKYGRTSFAGWQLD